jgi:hypothetical protein
MAVRQHLGSWFPQSGLRTALNWSLLARWESNCVNHILEDGLAFTVRCERFCLPFSISDMLTDDPNVFT